MLSSGFRNGCHHGLARSRIHADPPVESPVIRQCERSFGALFRCANQNTMRTPHSFRFRHFTVIALYTCAAALQGQDQGLPVRPTAQWELNACILAPLATGEPTAASASIQEGATWRASVGYRPGRRLVLLAGYGMCVSRRGESANDHITGSSVTWDFLFGTTTVLEHGCDLLTTKEAVHTLALDAAWLVRPFRDRHLIGMSFRAVGGLYVVGVRAEQGLVLGAR